jgi:hypothetical protein
MKNSGEAKGSAGSETFTCAYWPLKKKHKNFAN